MAVIATDEVVGGSAPPEHKHPHPVCAYVLPSMLGVVTLTLGRRTEVL
jgi:hypothetical protein